MLSLVLLRIPQNTTTSLLFSRHYTGSRYLNEYRIQTNITRIQHTSILPALPPPSAVHDPTTSFNPFLFHSTITSPFCHPVTYIFQSLICHSCPLFGTNSHQFATNI